VFKIKKIGPVISSKKVESTSAWAYLHEQRNQLRENRRILCACTSFLFSTTNGEVREVNGLIWRIPPTKASMAEK